MTKRNLVRLLIAQTVLMVLLGWCAVYLGRDEFRLAVDRDDEEAMPAPSLLAEEEAGQLPEVRLNATAQRQAGVELVQLDGLEMRPQVSRRHLAGVRAVVAAL